MHIAPAPCALRLRPIKLQNPRVRFLACSLKMVLQFMIAQFKMVRAVYRILQLYVNLHTQKNNPQSTSTAMAMAMA
jgi:hypothetical protein